MPATVRLSDSSEQLRHMVAQHLEDAPRGVTRVLLVPTSADVDAWRSLFATSYPELAFGTKVATMTEYIEEKWELFGDGRDIASTGSRIMAMMAAVKQTPAGTDGEKLPPTPGTVDMLSRVAAKGFGMPGMSEMLAGGEDCSSAEGRIWAALRRYSGLLAGNGLIEQGEALLNLACTLPEEPVEVAAGFSSFTGCQIAFLERRGCDVFFERGHNDAAFAQIDALVRRFANGESALRAIGAGGESSADGDSVAAGACPDGWSRELYEVREAIYTGEGIVEPTGDVRFAFSTGTKVEPQLVAEQVAQLVADGVEPQHIYVVNDALPPALDVQERLRRLGISSCGKLSQNVAQTQIGKAFAGLLSTNVTKMCDFAISPFSGMSAAQARKIGASWRSMKDLMLKNVLDDIAGCSDTSAQIAKAFEDGDFRKVLDSMMRAYRSRCGEFSESDVENLLPSYAQSTAANISSVMEFGAALGLERDECVRMLQLMDASARYQIVAEGSDETRCVEFGSLAAAGAKPRQAIVIPGFTAEAFPVSKDEDVSVQLLAKVGVADDDDYLASKRFDFYLALGSVSGALVLERSLADKDGNEQRPSVLFEELVDVYREDLDDFDSLDRATALPQPVMQAARRDPRVVRVMDEHDLSTLVRKPAYEGGSPVVVDAAGPQFDVPIDPRAAADLTENERRRIATAALGSADAPRMLSATFMESYMQCPYRWFVDKMIDPKMVGCSIDAIARGNFFHGVLSLAYGKICENRKGPARTDGMSQAQISNLVDVCAQEYIAGEEERNPQTPFAALLESEKLEIARYERQICHLLADDAGFLRGFTPTMFEKKFGEDGSFEYAGHKFSGIIDRVDVDESGRAMVIDYKGSVGEAYEIPGEDDLNSASCIDPRIPEKMQTMVYATAARRVLGLDVVGTVYRSYSHRREIAAVFDNHVVGEEQLFASKNLLGLRPDELAQLESATEDAVAEAIARMAEGNIEPMPRSKHSCEYCKAVGCPERRI